MDRSPTSSSAPGLSADSCLLRLASKREIIDTLYARYEPGIVVVIGAGSDLCPGVGLWRVSNVDGFAGYGHNQCSYVLDSLVLRNLVRESESKAIEVGEYEIAVINAIHQRPGLLFFLKQGAATLDSAASLLPAIITYSAMRSIWNVQRAFEWCTLERQVLSGELAPRTGRIVPPRHIWQLDGVLPRDGARSPTLVWSMIRSDPPQRVDEPPVMSVFTSVDGTLIRPTDRAMFAMMKNIAAPRPGDPPAPGGVRSAYRDYRSPDIEILFPAPPAIVTAQEGPARSEHKSSKVVPLRTGSA